MCSLCFNTRAIVLYERALDKDDPKTLFSSIEDDMWVRFVIFFVGGVLLFGFLAQADLSNAITVAPVAKGRGGMVVADSPLAARIGAEVLKQGGNAVDAAVATAFALGVVEPEASGLGGGGFMLIYLAKPGKSVGIDYRAAAPSAARPDMFVIGGPGLSSHWEGPATSGEQTNLRKIGGSAVAVPRMLAGMVAALRKYGSMSLAEVLAPAIKLAEDGFPVSATLYKNVLNYYPLIVKDPWMARTFLNNGLPYEPGELMTMPDLGRSLRTIATEGPETFYRGALAAAIVKGVQGHGGIISAEDLRNIQASECDPLVGTYHGFRIVTLPPPSSGAILVQILNILEGFNLGGCGSAERIHLMAEAYKLAFANRGEYLGDPAFVSVPIHALVSKELGVKLRARIDPRGASSYPPPISLEGGETTHVSVIDREGNMVALTQSLNSFLGAKFIIPGTGILMNNTMADFDPMPGKANSIAPGKEPLSSMSPSFLFQGDKPFLILGSAGAERILAALAEVIVNVTDLRLSLEKAISAPRFFCYASDLYLESRFPQAIIEALKEKGHPVHTKGAYDLYFGGVNAIQIVEKGEVFSCVGVADPRRFGKAAGY